MSPLAPALIPELTRAELTPAARLREEIAAMQRLNALLGEEQAALSAADAAGCERLLADKAALVSRLAALATERYRALGALGHPADEQGMQVWLGSDDAVAAGVPPQWQALLDSAREASELNRVNGVLLRQLMARNKLAMQTLGLDAAADVYGPAGHAHPLTPRAARAIG